MPPFFINGISLFIEQFNCRMKPAKSEDYFMYMLDNAL